MYQLPKLFDKSLFVQKRIQLIFSTANDQSELWRGNERDEAFIKTDDPKRQWIFICSEKADEAGQQNISFSITYLVKGLSELIYRSCSTWSSLVPHLFPFRLWVQQER